MSATSPSLLRPDGASCSTAASYGTHYGLGLTRGEKPLADRFSKDVLLPTHCPVPLCPPDEGHCEFPLDWQTCDTSEIGVKTAESFSKFQMRHFEADYPDVLVPPSILLENLQEEYGIQQRQRLTHSRERGCLGFIPASRSSVAADSRAAMGWLVHASGPNLNNLSCDRLEVPHNGGSDDLNATADTSDSFASPEHPNSDWRCSVDSASALPALSAVKDSVYKLKQRIHQVATRDVGGRGVAVAMTMNKCAVYQVGVECVDNGWMSPLSAVHSCEVLSAVDVNPHIYGEAILLGERGSLGMQLPDVGLCPLREAVRDANDPICSEWQSCHFSAHPRQLVIANTQRCSLFDMRSKPKADLVLFDVSKSGLVKPSHHLSAMAPHHGNNYLHMASTEHTVLLFDQRYPERPVLSWDFPWMTSPQLISLGAVAAGKKSSLLQGQHAAILSSCVDSKSVLFHFKDGSPASSLPLSLKRSQLLPSSLPSHSSFGSGAPPCSTIAAGQAPMLLGGCNVFPYRISPPPALCGGVLDRLETPLCGNAIVPVPAEVRRRRHGNHFFALQMNMAGDVFVQTVQSTMTPRPARSHSVCDDVTSSADEGNSPLSPGRSSGAGTDCSMRDVLARQLDQQCAEMCHQWLASAVAQDKKLQPGGKPNSFGFRNPGRPRRSINCSQDGSRTASRVAIQVDRDNCSQLGSRPSPHEQALPTPRRRQEKQRPDEKKISISRLPQGTVHQPEKSIQAPVQYKDCSLLWQYVTARPVSADGVDLSSYELCISCFHGYLPVVGEARWSSDTAKTSSSVTTTRGISVNHLGATQYRMSSRWKETAKVDPFRCRPCEECGLTIGLPMDEVLYDDRWFNHKQRKRQLTVAKHVALSLHKHQQTANGSGSNATGPADSTATESTTAKESLPVTDAPAGTNHATATPLADALSTRVANRLARRESAASKERHSSEEVNCSPERILNKPDPNYPVDAALYALSQTAFLHRRSGDPTTFWDLSSQQAQGRRLTRRRHMQKFMRERNQCTPDDETNTTDERPVTAAGLDFQELVRGKRSSFAVVRKPRSGASLLTNRLYGDWSSWSRKRRTWRAQNPNAIPVKPPGLLTASVTPTTRPPLASENDLTLPHPPASPTGGHLSSEASSQENSTTPSQLSVPEGTFLRRSPRNRKRPNRRTCRQTHR